MVKVYWCVRDLREEPLMKDEPKNKKQLVEEMAELWQEVDDLENSEPNAGTNY